MSNIFYDLNHYNLRASAQIDYCSLQKKDLENLIFKISTVQGY